MTVESVIAILSALGAGGLISKIVDEYLRGRREARRAKGLTPDARDEAAFYAEELAALRERCLAAGMSLEDLGPRPVWDPPDDEK